MTKEELLDLFYANEDLIEWDRYDLVDPPYCWSLGFSFTVDGYTFVGDCEIIDSDEELE